MDLWTRHARDLATAMSLVLFRQVGVTDVCKCVLDLDGGTVRRGGQLVRSSGYLPPDKRSGEAVTLEYQAFGHYSDAVSLLLHSFLHDKTFPRKGPKNSAKFCQQRKELSHWAKGRGHVVRRSNHAQCSDWPICARDSRRLSCEPPTTVWLAKKSRAPWGKGTAY